MYRGSITTLYIINNQQFTPTCVKNCENIKTILKSFTNFVK